MMTLVSRSCDWGFDVYWFVGEFEIIYSTAVVPCRCLN